jgi:hypothetical protein
LRPPWCDSAPRSRSLAVAFKDGENGQLAPFEKLAVKAFKLDDTAANMLLSVPQSPQRVAAGRVGSYLATCLHDLAKAIQDMQSNDMGSGRAQVNHAYSAFMMAKDASAAYHATYGH